jgi:hypothetical protein
MKVTKIFSDNTFESDKKAAIEIIETLPLEDLEILEKLVEIKTPIEIIKIINDNYKSRPTSTTKTATPTNIFSNNTFESKKKTTIEIIETLSLENLEILDKNKSRPTSTTKTTVQTSLNNTTLSQTNGSENYILIVSISASTIFILFLIALSILYRLTIKRGKRVAKKRALNIETKQGSTKC